MYSNFYHKKMFLESLTIPLMRNCAVPQPISWNYQHFVKITNMKISIWSNLIVKLMITLKISVDQVVPFYVFNNAKYCFDQQNHSAY